MRTKSTNDFSLLAQVFITSHTMPPKYSTRRHKYKNKNAKTNKLNKKKKGSFAQLRKRRIERPDEVTFNDSERMYAYTFIPIHKSSAQKQ